MALAVAAIVLLSGLRTSLIEQLDDSVGDQAIDYSVNVVDLASLDTVGFLYDIDTLLVIFDDTGAILLDNDTGVESDEVLAEVPFAESLVDADPLLFDVSIESATDTSGSDAMRAAVTPLFLQDQLDDDPALYVMVARSMAPIDATVASTRNRLMVIMPLLVLLVAGLAWWLTGRSLRPVDHLRDEVDDITAGDLRRRLTEPGSGDEIDRLAQTMNGMLTRLDESVQRQQQFVSDAAHELRTPLASMAAQLDVDAAHPASADLASTADTVRQDVSRMQQLIDSLLVLARSDQSDVQIERRLVDLDETARVAANRVVRPEAIRLDTSQLHPVETRGDAGALGRIFDNLVANAYRHATTQVVVASGGDEHWVWATVDDDGAGVPEASREQIFERFVRLDEARTRDRGGSGLGLALAREIALAHGGELFVTTAELGGARFVLRLPGA